MRVYRCRSTFISRGIPVDRVGSLKAAHVASEFDAFDAMTSQGLADAHADFGMPVAPGLLPPRHELLGRLRDVTLWLALPESELQMECRQRGLPAEASKECRTEEERKQDLLDHLLLRSCSGVYEAMGVPAGRLQSFQACANVAADWAGIELLSDADLSRRSSDLGLNKTYKTT